MAKIKVWGGRWPYSSRIIIATTSEQKAADACKVSKSEVHVYWSVTGNKAELEVALANIGVPFVSMEPFSTRKQDYVPLEQWRKKRYHG